MLAQFLQALAPSEGSRALCLAPGGETKRPGHANMCATVADMAKIIQHARDNNLQCWVSPCAFSGSRRKADDAVEGRLVGIDVDLKPPKERPDAPVFSSKAHAAAEVQRAVSIGAPPPSFVVDSGRGLHLWFVFEDSFDTVGGNRGSQYAAACTAIWDAYSNINPAFGVDESRKAELSSLLRMPSTFHLKDPNDPKLVDFYKVNGQHLSTGQTLPNDILKNLPAPKLKDPFKGKALALSAQTFKNGICVGSLADRLKISSFKHVYDNCAMLQHYWNSHRGTVGYDFWRGLIRWTAETPDGREWAHALSKDHPGYNPADVDAKFDNATGDVVPPPLCSTLASIVDPTLNVCAGCPTKLSGCKWPHENPKARAAAVAASRPQAPQPTPAAIPTSPQPAQQPVYAILDPADEIARDTPPELDPATGNRFTIDASSRTCATIRDKNGMSDVYPLFDHAVWADRVVWNTIEQRYDLLFKASRVKNGKRLTREVEVPLRALSTDFRSMASPFADAGVSILNVTPNAKTWLAEFCIAEHARVRDRDEAIHAVAMGWQTDKSFVVANEQITASGEMAKARLSGSLKSSASRFERSGSVDAQKQMLKIYERYGSDIAKFVLCCSVGSPAHGIAGHGAPLVVLTGKSAVGKTALCRAALSIWSNPRETMLTPRDTILASYARAGIMNNLPIFQDEITFNEVTELAGMVHALSSGGDRATMTQKGQLRDDSPRWAATAVWTSNTSIVRQLSGVSYANDAVVNRVMELKVDEPTLKLSNPDHLAALDLSYNANCGGLGVELGKFYAKHRDDIAKLHEHNAALASKLVPGGRSGTLRYWVQAVQTALTGARILDKMGLMMIDQQTAIAITGRLVQQALGSIDDRRETADMVLRTFVSDHLKRSVQIVEGVGTDPNGNPTPARASLPEGGHSAVMRIEKTSQRYRIWVQQSYFSQWLSRRGSQLSALVAAAYNEGLTRMTSIQPANVDLYAGVNRVDRTSGVVDQGYVPVQTLEFSLPIDKNQIVKQTATPPAQVVPFPNGAKI